jgi:hypothetical protein
MQGGGGEGVEGELECVMRKLKSKKEGETHAIAIP